jgi:hypothetical protein
MPLEYVTQGGQERKNGTVTIVKGQKTLGAQIGFWSIGIRVFGVL